MTGFVPEAAITVGFPGDAVREDAGRAEPVEHVARMIARASRRAAGYEQRVSALEGVRRRRAQSRHIVADDTADDRIAAGLCDLRSEGCCVHVTHAPWPGRDIEGDELVARREDGHARDAQDDEVTDADGRGERDIRGPQSSAGRHEHLARTDIVADLGDVLADADRPDDFDHAGGPLGVFDHDDRVSALRQTGSC
jgi:hypothetical protein